MKRKILAILGTLVMILSMFVPMTVFAAEDGNVPEAQNQMVQLTVTLKEFEMTEKTKTDTTISGIKTSFLIFLPPNLVFFYRVIISHYFIPKCIRERKVQFRE
jgi:hypothetical protein